MKGRWFHINEGLPPLYTLVIALTEDKELIFAERVDDAEGWLWAAQSDYAPYVRDGKIVADTLTDDDYKVTYWCAFLGLPDAQL